MKKLLGFCVVLALAPAAHAADIEAGKAKVAMVCAACHGAAGVSVSDTIPNLAAQRAGYLEAQLKALKDGTRKNPLIMFMSVEIMLNSANLLLIAFSRLHGREDGQIFAISVMAIAASEVVVGLGLIVAMGRRGMELDVDKLTTLRG